MPELETKSVGLVILGANGYMGHDSTLACLPQVKRDLQSEEIKVEIISLVDFAYFDNDHAVASKARARAAERLAEMGLESTDIEFVHSADRAISRLLSDMTFRKYDVVIVYDATPAQSHEDNFNLVSYAEMPNVFYFGEKPIFLDPEQLKPPRAEVLSNIPFFCNFIETADPAAMMIRQLIFENKLTIRDMGFWRASASGIKHLVGHTQKGVQGGAILDKAPHDLALATMFLGVDLIESFDVSKSEVHHLIPKREADGRYSYLDKRSEFISGESVSFDFSSDEKGSRMTVPADGLSDFSLQWHLTDGRQISSHFLFSWLGYLGHRNGADAHPEEKKFVEILHKLNIDPALWLLTERYKGDQAVRPCVETQARIAIIDAVDVNGDPNRIVGNFLIHQREPGAKAFDRWVKMYQRDAPAINIPIENAPTYHEQKLLDLARVFKSVILDRCGRKRASDLGTLQTLLVHDAMLQAHDRCYSDASSKHQSGKLDAAVTWQHIESCMAD